MADPLQTNVNLLPISSAITNRPPKAAPAKAAPPVTSYTPDFVTAEQMAPALQEQRSVQQNLLTQADQAEAEAKRLESQRNVARAEEKSRLREQEATAFQNAPQQQELKLARDQLKNAAFIPSKDNAQDIATMFSLVGLIGMAIGGGGKISAYNTMGAMNGMLEGYQKGRVDLYKKEKDVFDKNIKLMQNKVTILQSELQEAAETFKTNRELGEQKAEIAFAKADSPILEQMAKKQGIMRTLENVNATAKDMQTLVGLLNKEEETKYQMAIKERDFQEQVRARREQEAMRREQMAFRREMAERKEAQRLLPSPRASAINERYANTVYRAGNEVLRSLELVEQIGITRGGGIFAGVVGKGTIPTQLQSQLGQYFTSEQEKNYNSAMAGIALEMAYVLNGGYKPDAQTVNKIETLLSVTPNDTVGNAAYKFADVAAKLKAAVEVTPTYTPDQKRIRDEMMVKLDRYALPEVVYERQYGIPARTEPMVRSSEQAPKQTKSGASVSNWGK
jgi:hypothetical protein